MKTAKEIAHSIVVAANNGYHDIDSDYPPYALTPWDDRKRWTNYIEKIAEEVLTKELAGKE